MVACQKEGRACGRDASWIGCTLVRMWLFSGLTSPNVVAITTTFILLNMMMRCAMLSHFQPSMTQGVGGAFDLR